MPSNCVIYFEEKIFKTPYTVILEGNSAVFGSMPNFELEYTGAGIIQRVGYIPHYVLPFIKEDLNDIIGYGPFEQKKKEKLKDCRYLTYVLDRGEAFRK